MNKTIKKILAVIIIGGTLVGVSACTNNGDTSSNSNLNPWEVVCYYGCPNSKRVKKLNTKKRGK